MEVTESVTQQYSHEIEDVESDGAKGEMKLELTSKQKRWVCQDGQDESDVVGG